MCKEKKEYSSGNSRYRQYEVMKFIRENYPNRLRNELFEYQLVTQRVILPDDNEVIVWYDYKESKVTSMDIPKTPILKCRACGFTFNHDNKGCNCPKKERLYIDIDTMNYYYRIVYTDDNNLEKLEIIRDIEK